MLSWQDCRDLCELTPEEIDAVACAEHLPEICAAELGAYLCETPEGLVRLAALLRDEVQAALARGDLLRAAMLRGLVRRFVERHPDAGARGDDIALIVAETCR